MHHNNEIMSLGRPHGPLGPWPGPWAHGPMGPCAVVSCSPYGAALWICVLARFSQTIREADIKTWYLGAPKLEPKRHVKGRFPYLYVGLP